MGGTKIPPSQQPTGKNHRRYEKFQLNHAKKVAGKKVAKKKWEFIFIRAREGAPNGPERAQNFLRQGAPMVNVTPLKLALIMYLPYNH